MKSWTILSVFLFGIEKASSPPVRWLIMVRICWYPNVETLGSVIISMAILSKGQSGKSIICKGYIWTWLSPSYISATCNVFADILVHILQIILSLNMLVGPSDSMVTYCIMCHLPWSHLLVVPLPKPCFCSKCWWQVCLFVML